MKVEQDSRPPAMIGILVVVVHTTATASIPNRLGEDDLISTALDKVGMEGLTARSHWESTAKCTSPA